MSDPITTLRIPPEITARADALIPRLQGDLTLRAMGRISRSAVFRLALLRGLEVLEAKYPDPNA